MDRVARLGEVLDRMSRPSARTRVLLPPAVGIVAGVLLIAVGQALAQIAGVALVGLGLLLARGWIRIADAWWNSPVDQLHSVGRGVRERSPSWAWPATVAVLMLVAVAILGRQIARDGQLNGRTLGNVGKGAIALVMMGTLVFWSVDGLPGRLGRWFGRWSAGVDGARPDSAGEPEERADT